jgi:hypothetical protein
MVSPVEWKRAGSQLPPATCDAPLSETPSAPPPAPAISTESVPPPDPAAALALVSAPDVPRLALGLSAPLATSTLGSARRAASAAGEAKPPTPPAASDDQALRSLRVHVSLPNDNWGCVIPKFQDGKVLFGTDHSWASGDDFGYTHGLSLSADWKSGDWALNAALSSDLYSQPLGTSWIRDDGRLMIDQESVDVTKLSFGGLVNTGPVLSTRLEGELGLRNLGLAMALQSGWHSMIPAYIPAHHVSDPITPLLGLTMGERVSLAGCGLEAHAEAGGHAVSYEGSSYLYGSFGASAKLGPLSLSAEREVRRYGPDDITEETRLGAGIDFGAFDLALQGTIRDRVFNTPLVQYDTDKDVVLTVSLSFPVGQWIAGPPKPSK